jgi:DNA-binding NtrC family response regulator/tetratricopeptide (TPR) repeat protein
MLIADRFISHNGRTIDLASGEPVRFRRLSPGEPAQQVVWSERCAALSRLVRPRGAPLVDYGLLNDGERFEAHRIALARRATRAAYAHPAHLVPARPRERVVGDMRLGDPLDCFVQQAADLFATASHGQPRRFRLLLAGRPARLVVLDVIARQARLNGFVPVSVGLLLNAERSRSSLCPHLREIVENRHLLLIADAPVVCRRHGWCAGPGEPVAPCPVGVARLVLASGVTSARPNVLLALTHDDRHAAVATPVCLAAAAPHPPLGAARLRLCPARSGAPGGRSPVAAETHETYQITGRSELVRLRARAVEVVALARSGQALRAEQGLRAVMGALARREDAGSAGWVALSLGCLLLDRGRALDAARTFETARAQFDRANELPGAVRAAVYLGLAWTDEGRLTEAEAACRTAQIAAREAGLADLSDEASLGLARCLYWQGRFDEAMVLASSLVDCLERTPASTSALATVDAGYPPEAAERPVALVREAQAVESWGGEPRPVSFHRRVAMSDGDKRVRMTALAARLALVKGDVRGAAAHGARGLEAAARSTRAIDDCVAQTAVASVHGALHDVDGLLAHVRAGIAAARRAHVPLRALRLRLLACDALRLAGRQTDAARLHRHLARLDPARFPGLLRARLQIVVTGDGRTPPPSGWVARPVSQGLLAASCPWRLGSPRVDLAEEIAGVLQMCHEIEDEEAALGRVCDAVRERTRAVAVGLLGRNRGAAALLARSGPGAGRSTVADRVLDTGMAVAAVPTPLGLEAATPIRYAGAVIGAVACRWSGDALIDPGRAGCLLSAAAAATAPHMRTLLDRRESAPGEPGHDEAALVGVSEAIQALRKAALRAAGAPFPVLIEGESGSGKELVARAIHRDSPRRARRFCALNCAALTDELLEAELFGHARGAFTGAVTDRVGLFEEADGGTLFLDEVADLSARAQAKLLRALQDGEVRRIGENFARHVDARVIAATNRRLDAEVTSGTFRRDLFYRLNVVHIEVPPLRERPEDIAVLAAHFWARSIARVGSRATLAPSTVAALARYDWPGNVRELQNAMASLAVSAPRRGSVGPACLPAAVARLETGNATLDEARRVFERRFVQAALAHVGGHRARAAAALGISRQGLAKLIARLGLGTDSEE